MTSSKRYYASYCICTTNETEFSPFSKIICIFPDIRYSTGAAKMDMISMLINAILCYRSHTDLHMTL